MVSGPVHQIAAALPSTATLRQALDRTGITGFLERFPAGNPRLSDWAAAVDRLAPDVRPVHEFLLLGRPVSSAELPLPLRDFLPVLLAAGVLHVSAGRVQLDGAVLMRPAGVWLLAAPPSPFDTDLYFGADSFELAGQLDVRQGSLVLDLCCGTGLQALTAARQGAVVHAVDISTAAVEVARTNVALNGFAERVDVLAGDLYAPLPAGTVYDQVIANVPFLPGVVTGPDGFAVGRAVLRGLPARLAPGGSGCLTALVPVTADGFVLPDGVRAFLAQTGRELLVQLGQEWAVDAGSAMTQAIADEMTGDEMTGDDFAGAVAQVVDGFRRRGIVGLRMGFLHIGRATGTATVRFTER